MLFHLPGRRTVNLLCALLIQGGETSYAHQTAASSLLSHACHYKLGSWCTALLLFLPLELEVVESEDLWVFFTEINCVFFSTCNILSGCYRVVQETSIIISFLIKYFFRWVKARWCLSSGAQLVSFQALFCHFFKVAVTNQKYFCSVFLHIGYAPNKASVTGEVI